MPPPGLQNYLGPRVTLTFDLLTPRVDRFMSLPRGPLVPIGSNICSYSPYAASAWWGTVSASRHLSNEASSLVWCGAHVSSLAELVDSADDALFQRILYKPNHVLHSLLPDLNATGHSLRHGVLHPKPGILQINNYLIRQLYRWYSY